MVGESLGGHDLQELELKQIFLLFDA